VLAEATPVFEICIPVDFLNPLLISYLFFVLTLYDQRIDLTNTLLQQLLRHLDDDVVCKYFYVSEIKNEIDSEHKQ
jgi:hypothetical protein